MRPVYRGPAPVRVNQLRETRPNETVIYAYHAVGAYLLRQLGEYCSYCETALCGNAAIEHIIAKAFATQEENRWTNFLLACVNCNSTKGTKVDRVTDLAGYIWPCTPRDVRVGGTDYLSPWGRFEYYLEQGFALVRARPGEPGETEAANTLKLVGLDKERPDDSAVRDRRIDNRTRTWRAAEKLVSDYIPYLNQDGSLTKPFGRLLEQQIIDVATGLGFWSVWMTVFEGALYRAGKPMGVTESVLRRLFCDTFPGTWWLSGPPLEGNYTGLPLGRG